VISRPVVSITRFGKETFRLCPNSQLLSLSALNARRAGGYPNIQRPRTTIVASAEAPCFTSSDDTEKLNCAASEDARPNRVKMSPKPLVTSCLQNVSTRMNFSQTQHSPTPRQAQKPPLRRFIGRVIGPQVLCPPPRHTRRIQSSDQLIQARLTHGPETGIIIH